MNKYGSDKPDTRYEMFIHDLSPIFKDSDFKVFSGAIADGGYVKGIAVKNGAKQYSRKKIEEKQDYIKRYHAKGLAWVKYEDGEFSGPVSRFLTDENKEALKKEFDLEGGELVVFVADKWKVVTDSLDHLRREFAKETGIIQKMFTTLFGLLIGHYLNMTKVWVAGLLLTTHLLCQMMKELSCLILIHIRLMLVHTILL